MFASHVASHKQQKPDFSPALLFYKMLSGFDLYKFIFLLAELESRNRSSS